MSTERIAHGRIQSKYDYRGETGPALGEYENRWTRMGWFKEVVR